MRRGVVYVVAFGCAAILLPIAAAPAPFKRFAPNDAAKKDQSKLQGTWYTVSTAYGLGAASGEDKGDTITYEGNKYVQRQNGRVYQVGTFAIVDATANPKQIEYTCTEGDHKGLHFRSIYTLDGDEHQICSDNANDKRPKEFSRLAGFLRVTKRQKN
jgi:uncharacterized protein (TIGR03067 family)